jgi:hypothetical protein
MTSDALAELRTHRPSAPAELRERVRLIAGAEPARPRRLTWRRSLLVLAPAAVAVVALGIAFRGSTGPQQRAVPLTTYRAATPTRAEDAHGAGATSQAVPAPSGKRLQDYEAYLRLRVRNGDAVSAATQQAISIARRLGGFPLSVSVANGGREGDATITLRVPVGNVQEAVARLSALGTILGERVSIQDVEGGVNATDREIARLQRRLRELRAQEPTDTITRQIRALTAEVQRLQRNRANTVRRARLATVSLELTTRQAASRPGGHGSGPLDGAWTALRWIGIGLLYAVIVGGPFVLAAAAGWGVWRISRRRAEARLLETS